MDNTQLAMIYFTKQMFNMKDVMVQIFSSLDIKNKKGKKCMIYVCFKDIEDCLMTRAIPIKFIEYDEIIEYITTENVVFDCKNRLDTSDLSKHFVLMIAIQKGGYTWLNTYDRTTLTSIANIDKKH